MPKNWRKNGLLCFHSRLIVEQNMENQSYTTAFLVDQTPEEVFNAIHHVRGWWSEEIEGRTTEVRFTHVGLVPSYECYSVCSDAWGLYINGSLRNLITKGKGKLYQNEQIANKHGLACCK